MNLDFMGTQVRKIDIQIFGERAYNRASIKEIMQKSIKLEQREL